MKKRTSLLLLIMILLTFSCKENSQDPRRSFADGKLPKILNEIANPKLTKRAEQELLKKSGKNTGLVVAVMDNGVDYLHPGIIHNINFKVENGKIVGAGRDIMGDDNWAHPTKIDPTLFAFGAQEIDQDGRIIGPMEDPLKHLIKINDEFVSTFIKKLHSDPILKNSLFTKLHSGNFSLLDVWEMIGRTEEYGNPQHNRFGFNIDDYLKTKKERKLYNKDSMSNLENLVTDKRTVFSLIHQGWSSLKILSSNEELTYYGRLIEGADRFYALLEEVYQNFEIKYNIPDGIQNLSRYMNLRSGGEDKLHDVLRYLGRSIIKAKYKEIDRHPLSSMMESIRDVESINDIKYFLDPQKSSKQKLARIRQILLESHKLASSYLDLKINSEYIDHKDKVELKEIKKIMPKRTKEFLEILEAHPDLIDIYLGPITSRDELLKTPVMQDYISYNTKVKHPYLTNSSADVSHGTHVSGTIIAQEPRVRIEPIRVLTYSTTYTKTVKENLTEKMLREFIDFVSDERSLVAIYNHSDFRKLVDPKGKLAPTNKRNITKLKNIVVSIIKESSRGNGSAGNLDIEFFIQINDAVKYIGENEIKLTNISLGTEFSDVTDQINPNDIEKAKNDFTRFMQYEYFKYSLAKQIEKYAPHSIFMVAAGNSGKWVDGRSRSALPNDISSPFFKAIQNDGYAPLPNNRIKNIISVGSIGREGYLSSFTNLVVSDVPYILTLGESVRSAIKLTDNKGAQQEFEELYGKQRSGKSITSISNEEIEQMGALLEITDHTERQHAKFRLEKQISLITEDIISDMNEHNLLSYCINSQVCDAYYNGTSMATPHSTGLMSKIIINKMEAMGLSQSEIYDHPDFAPEVLYQDLFETSSPYREGVMKDVGKLTEIKDYKRVQKPALKNGKNCHEYVRMLLIP